MFKIYCTYLLVIIAIVQAIPKPEDDVKNRVIDKDLSDQEHFVHSHHNPEYDHEAFLGEDSKTFDKLTPEESVKRLGLIVDKIDKDQDGFITEEELKDWIRFTQQRYIRDDVERQWKSYDSNDTGIITWDTYKNMVYGFMDEKDYDANTHDNNENFSYAVMLKRDRRRWSVADEDGDDALTKDEVTAFLHPEDTERMKDVVVLETMEDIDKDGDGKISLIEYIGDMYPGRTDDDESEPEWVKNEREHFSSYRDKDGDGYMDADEVKNWIIPEDFDHAEAEARHLIYEADSDTDQKLTKEEILNKYDVFVGSQATDFGAALTRHDEF